MERSPDATSIAATAKVSARLVGGFDRTIDGEQAGSAAAA
jgi:hypothetical protein